MVQSILRNLRNLWIGPMKLDHVGIAVRSLREAVPVFEKLLGAPVAEEVVEDQRVRIVAFTAGESHVELLEPTASDSPVARFLAKRGPGIHHLTLAVPEIEKALAELERSGIELIDPAPREGAGKERIAFLHPKSTAGILIELVEEKSQKDGD